MFTGAQFGYVLNDWGKSTTCLNEALGANSIGGGF
jgi:hypothetical protein